MSWKFDPGRRTVLRGVMAGAAINVGLPILDCFLNDSGTAFASGAPLPVCFGTWFQGLGYNPGFWEPKTAGANYEMAPQLRALTPLKHKINIFSGLKVFANATIPVHAGGVTGGFGGGFPKPGDPSPPSLDMLIADVIGTRTRFRSLEVSCDGSPTSYSSRGGSVVNPAEISPAALYARIFGSDFKDPNAADFKPDPKVLARRSALSAVSQQRESLLKSVGAADRARLDEYFTSLRSMEQQLDLQLQKPAPLEACTVPAKPAEATPGVLIDDALTNHRLFMALLAHALACGQTRVFNVVLSVAASGLRRPGSSNTFHTHTHEEAADPKLGYQPNVAWFQERSAEAFLTMAQTLDGIREGDRTLLDRTVVMYTTDVGYAKLHTSENIPMLTVGGAGGRIKTGYHVAAPGDTMARLGLTLQQALGVPVSSWGSEGNLTSRAFTEVLA
jgi:Protein of unknown function (DUF1552)